RPPAGAPCAPSKPSALPSPACPSLSRHGPKGREQLQLRIPVTVEFSYGGTEAHIPGDYRYGVCVTETGSSITANGLRIIGKLSESNTVLIANQDVQLDEKKKEAIHIVRLLISGA